MNRTRMMTKTTEPVDANFIIQTKVSMKKSLIVLAALAAVSAHAAVVVVPARAVVVARPAPAPARVSAPAPKPATPVAAPKPAPAKTAPVEHDANVSNMPHTTPVVVPSVPVRSNAVNNKCDDERRKAGDCR